MEVLPYSVPSATQLPFCVMKSGTAANKNVVGAQAGSQPCLRTPSIWTAGAAGPPLSSAVDRTNGKALWATVRAFNVCSSMRWRCGRGSGRAAKRFLTAGIRGERKGRDLAGRKACSSWKAAIFQHLEDEIASTALVAHVRSPTNSQTSDALLHLCVWLIS